MKLIEGKKYNLHMKYGKYGIITAFYAGNEGYQCDICNKKDLTNAFEFLVPDDNNISYEECCNGNFIDNIQIGKFCIKKIKIENVE